VGNAISRGNPELEEVLDRKTRYCSLPEALRDHFLWNAQSIVIAGTAGKTTTASLAAWVLTDGGADPSVFIGGIARNFDSSYRLGKGRPFVIEGDEYDSAFFDKTAKFFKYLPDVVVVTNVEYDHADIYPNIEAIQTAFKRLVRLIPRRGILLLGSDSPYAQFLKDSAPCPVQTFGLSEGTFWHAGELVPQETSTRFTVTRDGQPFGTFDLPLLGEHNVRNALAAIAVAHFSGIGPDAIDHALRSFLGVKRRLEIRDVIRGVTIYDDFAHHPTKIAETLKAVRSANPGHRVWAVFEPRSASSCRRVFQQDFVPAFDAADRVIIAKVFRSSLPEHERLSTEELVGDLRARGKDAVSLDEVDDIVENIRHDAASGDLVVIMSNGGFGGIHTKLARALGA
jgi:UDP-N-acetylmuramate: L-alanyl-gamma-D-glutamyl-meso-diaminopimelate ligase